MDYLQVSHHPVPTAEQDRGVIGMAHLPTTVRSGVPLHRLGRAVTVRLPMRRQAAKVVGDGAEMLHEVFVCWQVSDQRTITIG